MLHGAAGISMPEKPVFSYGRKWQDIHFERLSMRAYLFQAHILSFTAFEQF